MQLNISNLTSGINIAAFHAVDSLANPSLNTVMAYIGSSFFIVLPLILVYLIYRKDRNAMLFAFSVVFLYAISETIKLIVREPRPCDVSSLYWINKVGCESSFSFPSSHATTLTGLYFITRTYKYLNILYIIWLFLVLFGRVYLGQHYLTDVIAGFIISIAVGYAIIRNKERINNILYKIISVVPNPISARLGKN
jgi:undecaprenyl-diphosphatase